ncbi:MAG: sigma-54 dependent transcriptional regulator [bacterium]
MEASGHLDSQTAILIGIPEEKSVGIKQAFESYNVSVIEANNSTKALHIAKQRPLDFAVIWSSLPDSTPIRLIDRLRWRQPTLITAIAGPSIDQDQRSSLIRQGADDYIEVDAAFDYTETVVRRMVIRRSIGIIGRNPRILQAIAVVESIAKTKVTVLITGESGTGKELIARAVHLLSDRSEGPFIAVNCAALPEGVLESELFGHEKGSFTGAVSQRRGRFELADGGTLLLDEIGEIPLAIQAKLLRVLEEEKIMRVGGSKEISIDVRIIASTNRDLGYLVGKGEFRQDLYYRLNVVSIHLPALRERKEDIRAIFLAALSDASKRNKIQFSGINDDALIALENYDWPGNVRELKNLAESLVVLCQGRTITLQDLPEQILRRSEQDRLPVLNPKPRAEIERDLLFREISALKDLLMVELPSIRENLAFLAKRIVDYRGEPAGRPIEALYRSIPTEEGASLEVQADGSLTVSAGTPIKQVEKELIETTLKKVSGNRKKAAKLLGIGERTLYRKMKRYGLS